MKKYLFLIPFFFLGILTAQKKKEDNDDMRSSSRGIDPRVMTGDLSGDQITYSIDRFKIINNALKKIK